MKNWSKNITLGNIWIWITLFGVLTACGAKGDKEFKFDDDNNLRVYGTLTEAKGQKVYLETVSPNGVISVAETTIENNKFDLQTNIPGLGIYQLRVGENPDNAVLLTAKQNDNIKIEASNDDFVFDAKISGVEWGKQYNEYMKLISNFTQKQAELVNLQDSISREEIIKRYLKLKEPIDNYARDHIKNNPASPFNIILIESLMPSVNGFVDYPTENLQILQAMYQEYQKEHAESPITQTIGDQVAQIEAGIQEYELVKSGKKEAPNIVLKSPEGKEIALASLQGKIVLVDFWASWCGPCRQENPNVVKLYNKYKNKGFTIYSVSLDEQKDLWVDAIKQDGLIWPNHVSDLLRWKSPLVKLYRIQGIPHTVLVGKDGYVIAEGLRGQELENKLSELLN